MARPRPPPLLVPDSQRQRRITRATGMVSLIADGMGPTMPSLRGMLTDQALLHVLTSLWSLGG